MVKLLALIEKFKVKVERARAAGPGRVSNRAVLGPCVKEKMG